jgi:hypothetical protein
MSNIGSSNRLIYDNCAYQKSLYESTSPLVYRLYEGNFENCQKCLHKDFIRPFDLVDIESELRNQTRFTSKCPQQKYNPGCTKSKTCTSTFDRTNPIVYAPEVCPIVYNNIPKQCGPGYQVPKNTFCN